MKRNQRAGILATGMIMRFLKCGTLPGARSVLVIVLTCIFPVIGAEAQEVNVHPIIEPPRLIGGKDTVMTHVYAYDLYPSIALDLDIDGDAIVQFTVDSSGTPINVELFQERPEGLGFGDSAVVAVKAQRFVVPQTRLPDGSIGKAPVLMQQVVRFRCDEYREYKRTHPNVRQVTRPAPPDPPGAMGWPPLNPEPPPQPSDYSTPKMPVRAEEMGIEPKMVGGEEALYEYIRTHNLYPQQAHDAAIESDVLLEYTVTPQGQIVDIKVVQERPGGLGFGDAARKAIEAMRYNPDEQQVKEELYLRMKTVVRFRMENEKRDHSYRPDEIEQYEDMPNPYKYNIGSDAPPPPPPIDSTYRDVEFFAVEEPDNFTGGNALWPRQPDMRIASDHRHNNVPDCHEQSQSSESQQHSSNQQQKAEDAVVDFFAEEEPPLQLHGRVELIGGLKALYEYIRDHDVLPQAAKDAGTGGAVMLIFTVNEEGKPEDIEVSYEIPEGLGFGEAAKDVLREMSYTVITDRNGEVVSYQWRQHIFMEQLPDFVSPPDPHFPIDRPAEARWRYFMRE